MARFKLTKGELKKTRDALRQYYRYLPTLQLKKQQLQAEILRALAAVEEKKKDEAARSREAQVWAGLLSDPSVDIRPWIRAARVTSASRNIAGVDIPVFEKAEFALAKYDLFITPLWVDAGIEALRVIASLRKEIGILEEGVAILKRELRTTTQRVNLFEKVKIPEAEEAIRVIKIYIGDQMTNAVGRSKMAKRKIEKAEYAEAAG
jgi:V/A-type H+-transporting ATPase subunit D